MEKVKEEHPWFDIVRVSILLEHGIYTLFEQNGYPLGYTYLPRCHSVDLRVLLLFDHVAILIKRKYLNISSNGLNKFCFIMQMSQ